MQPDGSSTPAPSINADLIGIVGILSAATIAVVIASGI